MMPRKPLKVVRDVGDLLKVSVSEISPCHRRPSENVTFRRSPIQKRSPFDRSPPEMLLQRFPKVFFLRDLQKSPFNRNLLESHIKIGPSYGLPSTEGPISIEDIRKVSFLKKTF